MQTHPLQMSIIVLVLNKTDYEMSFNCAGLSFHTVNEHEKFEMKILGCEILGTAAKTLSPLTNFPRESAMFCRNGFDTMQVVCTDLLCIVCIGLFTC